MTPFAWLRSLLPYLAVALLVGAWSFGCYRAGGSGPRAELEQLRAANEEAKRLHDAEDRRKAAETTTLITTLEGQRDTNARNAATGWAAYRGLLNKPRPGTSTGGEPVPVVAAICDDADANRRLSDALQGYRAEVRASMDELWRADQERGRATGQLLEQAEHQTGELIVLKAWAVGAKAINAQ